MSELAFKQTIDDVKKSLSEEKMVPINSHFV